ncbi:MAG: DUF4861 domain-containing protein [Phocaeicola sp.]
MNKHLLLALLTSATITTAATAQNANKTITVTVSNSWNKAKTDEPVVINLHSLKKNFRIKSATVWENDVEIPSQLDDLDGDARADELAFVTDIAAQSKKTFRIVFTDQKEEKNYPSRTYAQMMAYSGKAKLAHITSMSALGSENVYNFTHHHGPAFESELVAYRIYFNEKQTVDPYGKFNKGLEIEETKFYPNDEHRKKGYGDDVLRVFNSCGVGSLRGWDGTTTTHIKPVVERTERVVASGPVRAIVDAAVTGWEYQGSELNMINRHILYAGHRDIQMDVLFDQPLGKETFATGAQILKEEASMISDHQGLVGSWGTDWPVNDSIRFAKESVGIGTYIPRSLVVNEVKDAESYLYTIQAKGATSFRYYTTFTSKKEKFGFGTPEAWFAYLREWKENLAHPCNVQIKENK